MANDLVKRLRDYEEYEQSRDGQIICVKSDMAQEAATYIEQLEAENRELAMQVLASGSQAQEAYEAQLKAEAATAAAYEVAARVITDRKSEMNDVSKTLVRTEKAIFAEIVSLLDFVADAIRAIATADQQSALDRRIAEAEARVWKEAELIARNTGTCLMPSGHFLSERCADAILAASKKGGA